MSSLKCKQKLCGFPEDKNSNRKKVLICKFNKNCSKWSAKRQIWSTNRDSRITNSNPDLASYMSWCTKFVSLKLCVGFPFFNCFFLSLYFCSMKCMHSLTLNCHKANTAYFFVVWAVTRIISGQLVANIKIILGFWVSTFKNKNIIKLKKLVPSCQLKLLMKPTTSIYSVIQQCQMH